MIPSYEYLVLLELIGMYSKLGYNVIQGTGEITSL
jgi:hypothetical protein